MLEVICDYCKNPAELIDSSEIYGFDYGKVWCCKPCDAWVGVHKHSARFYPLGRLANKELRYWKKEAHYFFDPLWQEKLRRENISKSKARNAGYKWLSERLGIKLSKCHIGMFDIDQCKKVVEICKPYYLSREHRGLINVRTA